MLNETPGPPQMPTAAGEAQRTPNEVTDFSNVEWVPVPNEDKLSGGTFLDDSRRRNRSTIPFASAGFQYSALQTDHGKIGISTEPLEHFAVELLYTNPETGEAHWIGPNKEGRTIHPDDRRTAPEPMPGSTVNQEARFDRTIRVTQPEDPNYEQFYTLDVTFLGRHGDWSIDAIGEHVNPVPRETTPTHDN